MNQGIIVKRDLGGTRIEVRCLHQSGLIYAVPADASWVCSEDLMHAHALAGFLKDLQDQRLPIVNDLMQRWGLYYRERPLDKEVEK